ncbi:hypothetical protein ACHAAJ_12055, partial [Arthrobacter sp. KK5.5]
GDRREGGFRKDNDRRENTGDDTRSFPGVAEGERAAHNPADLRSANRADRPRSPEIDDDVTGKELDRVTKAELRYLDEKNLDWVSKHLVMAGRLIDLDAELAHEHALAASRRGGRVAVVREAVGLTAYASGQYADALREFRTYRRISGSNIHLPIMADCERGLGKPEKALETAHSEEASALDAPARVEMAIVASGAQTDLGNREQALAELQIPELDINRAFSFSPRLFAVYADALEALGKNDEAVLWRRQVVVAENALGVGEFAEPEIMDLVDEDDEPIERKPRVKDVLDGDAEVAGVDAEDGLTSTDGVDLGAEAVAEPEDEAGESDADVATGNDGSDGAVAEAVSEDVNADAESETNEEEGVDNAGEFWDSEDSAVAADEQDPTSIDTNDDNR